MTDEEGLIYLQSAVIPFREGDGGPEVLLITSRSGKRWIVPKGLIEFAQDARQAAAAEALEEAGIEGDIAERPVGEFEYRKWGGTCRVTVFLMRVSRVHDEGMEDDFRTRRWWDIDSSADLVPYPAVKAFLRVLPELIRERF